MKIALIYPIKLLNKNKNKNSPNSKNLFNLILIIFYKKLVKFNKQLIFIRIKLNKNKFKSNNSL